MIHRVFRERLFGRIVAKHFLWLGVRAALKLLQILRAQVRRRAARARRRHFNIVRLIYVSEVHVGIGRYDVDEYLVLSRLRFARAGSTLEHALTARVSPVCVAKTGSFMLFLVLALALGSHAVLFEYLQLVGELSVLEKAVRVLERLGACAAAQIVLFVVFGCLKLN